MYSQQAPDHPNPLGRRLKLLGVAALIAALAVTGFAAYTFRQDATELEAQLQRTTEDLRQESAALEDTRATLKDTRGELAARTESLEAANELNRSLESERLALTDSVRSLEEVRDGLLKEKRSLTSERDSFSRTIDHLLARNSRLESTITGLEEQRSDLRTQVSSLESQTRVLTATTNTLTGQKTQLEGQVRSLEGRNTTLSRDLRSSQAKVKEYEDSLGAIESLETRITGLRTTIRSLEEERKALVVESSEASPVCTGSMEPKITCLDTVVELENFRVEDITVGVIISFIEPGDEDDLPILHRVIETKTEDGVVYFRTQGDANDAPDDYWIPEGNVLGYVIDLIKDTRPDNSDLRNEVNEARAQYKASKNSYQAAEEEYDSALDEYEEITTKYCNRSPNTFVCPDPYYNMAVKAHNEVKKAFERYQTLYDAYSRAWCDYDRTYHRGKYESKAKSGSSLFEIPPPYIQPFECWLLEQA